MRLTTFRQRQLLTLLAVVAVLMGLVLGTVLFSSRALIIERTAAQVETVADLKTSQIEQWLNHGRDVALLVAGRSDLRQELPKLLDDADEPQAAGAQDNLRAELEEIATAFPSVRSVSLHHPNNGRELVATGASHAGSEPGQKDFFRQGQQGLNVSLEVSSSGGKAPVLVVSAPVVDQSGELLSVVAVEMNLENLEAMLRADSGLGEGGSIYLVDKYGYFVALPTDVAGAPVRTFATSEGVDRVLAGQNASSRYVDPRGVRVLGVYRWLPDLDLGLLVELEESVILTQTTRVQLLIILYGLVLLALAIIAARYLANWLVTPLEKISAAAQALRTGHMDHRAPRSGPDEIGQLADSFNEMADSLQHYSENLELMVQQRTVELREVNEELKYALAEKEVLLKEIHHRVKNNLQVISALLSLQADAIDDATMQDAFLDSQLRVQSMARVHEQLYGSSDLDRIEMEGYVQALADDLRQSYGSGQVPLIVDAGNVALDLEQAIPCGLIINELVSNSMKHAFPDQTVQKDGHREEVRIALRSLDGQPGAFELLVSDTGIGLPEDLDIHRTPTLGLRLVNLLARQLRGTVTLLDEGAANGTTFRVTIGELG